MNYLIIGTEKYLMNRQVKRIIKAQGIVEEDLNVKVYDCFETPMDMILEDAQTIPFFSDKKIVILKNPYFLTALQLRVSFEQNTDQLLSYLNKPLDSTILIIYAGYEKLDERKKIVKAIKKACQIIEIEAVTAQNIHGIVTKFSSKRQIQFENGALNSFCERVPYDMQTIINELDKLALYNPQVSLAQVHLLVSRKLEDNVFDLVEAVMLNDKNKAMLIYRDLTLQNEEPIKLIVLLANQIRLIYQVILFSEKGFSQKEIASSLGVHPYRVKLALEKRYQYRKEDLLLYLDRLAILDEQIKNGEIDKHIGLELFILMR